MIELIGVVGSVILSMSGIPLVIKVFKIKDVSNLSQSFLISWAIGAVIMFIYVINIRCTLPMIINFSVTLFNSLSLLLMYYIWRKK
jgi:uncharacterized protein with PQ loop repeat